jgi:hypothetical protein
MSTDYTSLEEGAQKKVSSYEGVQAEILHDMLQEAYNYAGHVPEKIHAYIQIADGRAGADFLFEIGGKVLEVHTLDQSDVELEFDLTPERKQMLMNNMAPHLLRFISHCATHKKPFPSEVWTSADTTPGGTRTTLLGYNYNRTVDETKTATLRWKKDLEDPSYAVMQKLSAIEPIVRTTLEF